jgi:hypothetical protein
MWTETSVSRAMQMDCAENHVDGSASEGWFEYWIFISIYRDPHETVASLNLSGIYKNMNDHSKI